MKKIMVMVFAVLCINIASAQSTGLAVTMSDTEAGKMVQVTMDGVTVTPDSVMLNGEIVESPVVTDLPSFIVTIFYAGKSICFQYTDETLFRFPMYLNR